MKHRKFPAPQISEAVFRGRKTPYSFEVYPLNIEFNAVPAVFVISRRKVDKYGRAHHAVLMMGQTESLKTEVKNQRKAKTIKDYQANTVSVLLSEDEKARLAIEADLKLAYEQRIQRKPAPPKRERQPRTVAAPIVEEKEKMPEVKSASVNKAQTRLKKNSNKIIVFRLNRIEKKPIVKKSKTVNPPVKSSKTITAKNEKLTKTKAETNKLPVKPKSSGKPIVKAKKVTDKSPGKKTRNIEKAAIRSASKSKSAVRSPKTQVVKTNAKTALKSQPKSKLLKNTKKVQPPKSLAGKSKVAIKKVVTAKKRVAKSKETKVAKASPKKVSVAAKKAKVSSSNSKSAKVQKPLKAKQKSVAKAPTKKTTIQTRTVKPAKKAVGAKAKSTVVSASRKKSFQSKTPAKRQTRKR